MCTSWSTRNREPNGEGVARETGCCINLHLPLRATFLRPFTSEAIARNLLFNDNDTTDGAEFRLSTSSDAKVQAFISEGRRKRVVMNAYTRSFAGLVTESSRCNCSAF